MVYSPTCTIKINVNVGKYTSSMDPMGYGECILIYGMAAFCGEIPTSGGQAGVW